MDFKDQDFNVLSMPEAVTKVSLGKPVYVLTQLYPETPLRVLASALGFVECRERPKTPAIVEQPKEPPRREKKPGPKKKVLPEPEAKAASKPIDIPKIEACYNANPPRTVDWIADEMGLTRDDVVSILMDLEIYRGD